MMSDPFVLIAFSIMALSLALVLWMADHAPLRDDWADQVSR